MSEPMFSKPALTAQPRPTRVQLFHLSTPEQFLISALRLWNQGRHAQGPCCCRSLLRNGFQAANLSQAAFDLFDRSIGAIDASKTNAAWIAAPRQAVLTCAEHRILLIIADCQRDELSSALSRLRQWLPHDAARAALTDLYGFAQACVAAGLVLRSDTQDRVLPLHVLPLRPRSTRLH